MNFFKVYYAEGEGSGLGSEFNNYLIFTIIEGIYTNRRIVNILSDRSWPYDCGDNTGWACYLKFPCEDSSLPIKYNELPNGSILHNGDNIIHDAGYVQLNLQKAYNEFYFSQESCNASSLGATITTAIIAHHVYHLNENTSRLVNSFLSIFPFRQEKYISVQIRTTDKRVEMDQETWDIVTNMTTISALLVPYMKLASIKHVFVATDDCDLISKLSLQVQSYDSNYIVHSACKHSLRHMEKGSPSRSVNGHAVRLLSEIAMLVGGEYLFGALQSNLVRMVYRLRYPNLENFIPFAYEAIIANDEEMKLDTLIT